MVIMSNLLGQREWDFSVFVVSSPKLNYRHVADLSNACVAPRTCVLLASVVLPLLSTSQRKKFEVTCRGQTLSYVHHPSNNEHPTPDRPPPTADRRRPSPTMVFIAAVHCTKLFENDGLHFITVTMVVFLCWSLASINSICAHETTSTCH